MRKVAFRCKSCGRLHTSDDAGEANHPGACSVCGAGVIFGQGHDEFAKAIVDPKLSHEQRTEMARKFSGKATKWTHVPENWEILADANDARLAELGLKKEDVEKHVPLAPGQITRPPHEIIVVGGEAPLVKDKAV